MSKPAHKNLDHPPGQLRFGVELDSGEFVPAKDIPPPKKKLSFEEWWNSMTDELGDFYRNPWVEKEDVRIIWESAQENK